MLNRTNFGIINHSNNGSPFFVVARLLFKPLIRRFGLPFVILNILNNLWGVISRAIASFGIFPVIEILLGIRHAIRSGSGINTLLTYGPPISAPFIAALTPIWKDLIKPEFNIFKIITLMIWVTRSYMFKPLVLMIFKYTIGLGLSALGFAWSALSNIGVLHDAAIFIKDMFYTILFIELPFPKIETVQKINNDWHIGRCFLTITGISLAIALFFLFIY